MLGSNRIVGVQKPALVVHKAQGSIVEIWSTWITIRDSAVYRLGGSYKLCLILSIRGVVWSSNLSEVIPCDSNLWLVESSVGFLV